MSCDICSYNIGNGPLVHTHPTLSKILNKKLLESEGASWEEDALACGWVKKKKALKICKAILNEEEKPFSSVTTIVY